MQPLAETAINVPAFLHKLWKMVNDPKTDHLICWSPTGTSFIIQNKAQFWYELLPVYYKHNNMSSFVRQLNMYGFHKITSLDSASENDKDEIHFYHHNFQKDRPEILKHIRRKVTNTQKNTSESHENALSSQDLNRVLADITILKGRQSNVDNQLIAMKQENAILWRELALLRQKHLKQQQIVNKLIQFLVTLVHPSRMNGLSTKRVLPLMIHESPAKKQKTTTSAASKAESNASSEGPIIHELDSPENENESGGYLNTGLLSEAANSAALQDEKQLDSSEYIQIQHPELNCELVDELLSDNDNETAHSETGVDPLNLSLSQDAAEGESALDGKVFITPDAQDTFLSNLMNGNYNMKSVNDVLLAGTAAGVGSSARKDPNNEDASTEKSVARKNILRRLNSVEDLDLHLESTQSEIDKTFKELLSGCTSLNANAILDLFNDEAAAPSFGLGNFDELANIKSDSLLSGSELTTYGNGLDFTQLLNEDSDELVAPELPVIAAETLDADGSITTPQILAEAPIFPSTESSSTK